MERIKKEYNKYKFCFWSTLIIGMLAHLFALTNKLVNHDEMEFLFSKGKSLELGRWGLELIQIMFPNCSMPWYNGIIALIFIAISVCIIVKILKIESKIQQCLIGGVMATFPAITSAMAYMFTITSYSTSILLAVMAAYLATKKENKIKLLLSVICLTISLGIYQAYISLTATIFIIILMQKCMNKDKELKEIIFEAIRYFIILVISLLLYLIVTKIVNTFASANLAEYQGFKDMGHITIYGVLVGIAKSYFSFIKILSSDWNGITIGIVLKILYLIIMIVDFTYIIANFIKAKKLDTKKAIAFLLFCCMLPVSMNTTYILSSDSWVHSIMVYADFFILILPIILSATLVKSKQTKFINKITYIILAIIIFQYITIANECYLRLKLAYNNNHSFYTTLITRIENTDGFDENTKIAFIGRYKGELLTNNNDKFKGLNNIVGIDSNYNLISANTIKQFIKQHIGVDFKYVSDELGVDLKDVTDEKLHKLNNLKEVKEMNIYPYDNSIKKIGDIIVVKFSHNN